MLLLHLMLKLSMSVLKKNRVARSLTDVEVSKLHDTVEQLEDMYVNDPIYESEPEFAVTSKLKFLPENRLGLFKTSYSSYLSRFYHTVTTRNKKPPKILTLPEYLPWYRNGIARAIRKSTQNLTNFGESRLLTKVERDKISEAAQILSSIIDKENYVKNTNYLKTKL